LEVTPEELLYTKTHEWVAVETDASGAKVATIGISAFALEALTDLVFVDLPETGRTVSAGEPFGEIESVKAVSDLYSPFDGEIVEVNEALADQLEGLSDEPYTNGWLVKIRINDETALAGLMDHTAYQKQCEQELADE
jgi:glycine cleavage system H protein